MISELALSIAKLALSIPTRVSFGLDSFGHMSQASLHYGERAPWPQAQELLASLVPAAS